MGIGTDVVSIERIAGVLERHGERFVNRVLTQPERARFERTKLKASHLAKRWAAKEAFAKAIGTGIHAPFTWQSITVTRDRKGAPGIEPSEAMAEYLRSRGVKRSLLTLTDDAGIAVAFVVLEG
ncbi:MAG TPA: holo-ACP synthase [Usitatibacter sp.]|nr:holo-ACP synthase [Usitatibacter sp.]